MGVRIRRDPDGVVHSGPSCSRRVAVTAAVKTCALFGEGFEGRAARGVLGKRRRVLADLRGGRVVEQDEQTVEHDPFTITASGPPARLADLGCRPAGACRRPSRSPPPSANCYERSRTEANETATETGRDLRLSGGPVPKHTRG